MDEQLKSNLTSGKHWLRFLFMVISVVCLQVARLVMWFVIGLQFLFALITGSDNKNLRAFGKSLSQYIFQALEFLTYNTDEKPFPFSEWPKVEPVDDALEGEVELAEHESDVEDEIQAEEVVVDDSEGTATSDVANEDDSSPEAEPEKGLETESEK